MHLILDGYGGDRHKLQDMDLVYRFLDEYPNKMGMTKVTPPYVFRYVGTKPEDWGITGFVIIAESHISVHTFPEHRYVNIDMFSCKEFDTDKAIAYLEEYFGLSRTESHVLARGMEYFHLKESDLSRTREAVASRAKP